MNSPASSTPPCILWLRRDLRLHDHGPLSLAARTNLPVQPIFIFDSDILARFKLKDDRRLTFIARTLCHLHEQLAAHQGGVIVLYGKAETLVPRLCRALKAQSLFAGRDYEPATQARDEAVARALGDIAFTRVKDHLLLDPTENLRKDGAPYKVFTPYADAWRRIAQEEPIGREHEFRHISYAHYDTMKRSLAAQDLHVIDPAHGAEAMLKQVGYTFNDEGWDVENARKKLHDFIDTRIDRYAQARDYMSVAGTSQLSAYLRFGLLGPRECLREALGREHHKHGTGPSVWINELIWRDFYAMILYHFPHTATTEFQKEYRGMEWSKDAGLFQRFAKGMTGYPIVDAAMRQLLATGFMHNRARMIVASFMSKDLLLDWRMGEEHFGQYLMDYELASNVGGWQWASSVGTDAQPYFRVFNPVLQSRKYDPDGEYIRAFVPELRHLSNRDIHAPWLSAQPADYPEPIVDHDAARARSVEMFRAARKAA